jgi:isopropylmalate/homocitrate/citramalate synthase
MLSKGIKVYPNKLFPKCHKGFYDWYKSNPKLERIYNNLGSPKPFDVTLRDGLQGLIKEEQEAITFNKKTYLYHEIYFNYHPINMEVGSIVSDKVFPIFKDSLDLFNYIEEYQKSINEEKSNNYLLIANEEKLKSIINTPVTNFSFISSISNNFQMQNTRQTLEEKDRTIKKMINILENRYLNDVIPFKIKLYISCINECPIG